MPDANSPTASKHPQSPRRTRRLVLLIGGTLALGVCLALAMCAHAWVLVTGSPGLYSRLEDVPQRPVAVVFGAKVYESGALSAVLDQRVRAGVALYHAGKVRKLLMTGDNGRVEYDEVTAMKTRAIELGVPARDIVRDFAGFRTYDSCYRARQVFGVDRAVLVTQEFHLRRALFLARQLGIDAVGYVAEPGLSEEMVEDLERREVLARVAAAVDTALHRRPRFLGNREPLFENPRDDR